MATRRQRARARVQAQQRENRARREAERRQSRPAPSDPVNPRSSAGQATAPRPQTSGIIRRPATTARRRETDVAPGQRTPLASERNRDTRPTVGVSREQFAPIAEQLQPGQHIEFNDRGQAFIANTEGQRSQSFADLTTPQERTLQQRAPADAPLQSPIAGAGGQMGELGFGDIIQAEPNELQLDRFADITVPLTDKEQELRTKLSQGPLSESEAQELQRLQESRESEQESLRMEALMKSPEHIRDQINLIGGTGLFRALTRGFHFGTSGAHIKDLDLSNEEDWPKILQVLQDLKGQSRLGRFGSDATQDFDRLTGEVKRRDQIAMDQVNRLIKILSGQGNFKTPEQTEQEIQEMNRLQRERENLERQRQSDEERFTQEFESQDLQTQISDMRQRQTSAVDNSALSALIASTPSELQGAVSGIGQEFDIWSQALASEQQIAGRRLQSAVDSGTRLNQFLQAQSQRVTSSSNDYANLVRNIARGNISALETRESMERQRLNNEMNRQRRQLSKQKREQTDRMTVALALSGGMESFSANNAITDAEREFDIAISDLEREFAFQKSDVSSRFTEQYANIQNKASFELFKISERLEDQLGSIEQQGFASMEAIRRTTDSIFADYQRNALNIYKGKADEMRTLSKEARDLSLKMQDIKRRDRDDAFKELQWYKENFGSDVPDGVIQSLSNRIPDINVESFLTTPFLDEKIKSTGGSGSAGAFAFHRSQIDGMGQPLSFENFLQEKVAEHENLLAQSMPLEQRNSYIRRNKKAFEKEYEEKIKNHERHNPSQIMLRLADRTSNSPKHVRENARSNVVDLISQSRYEDAARFVEGIGASLSAGERGDYIQALNARRNVVRITELLEEFGQAGPVTGRLREFDLWNVKQAELNALITQTVPGLARGIFKEVGVLTDQDVERYRATIPNGRSTLAQSQALAKQLLDTIDISLESQLTVHDDARLNIRDIRDRIQGSRVDSSQEPVASEDIDYISTLGY